MTDPSKNPTIPSAAGNDPEGSPCPAQPIERIAFFGTPEFAVPTLEALDRAGRCPQLVVSQPARRAGRGKRLQQTPVASWAVDRGVQVIQPNRVSDDRFMSELGAWQPDLAVVVAFGQIFKKSLLSLPRLGCVNVHASLLPAYRGASPISAAIANGETVTGVTTMVMEAGLDSGPILQMRELEILPTETCGELSLRLARLGGDLLVETVDALEAGEIEAREQDHSLATKAPMLSRADGAIDWSLPAQVVYNRIRAFDPWPGSHTTLRGQPLKILGARLPDSGPDPGARDLEGAAPGAFLEATGSGLLVQCGDRSRLELTSVQRPGRKALEALQFQVGERLEPGELLGDEAS